MNAKFALLGNIQLAQQPRAHSVVVDSKRHLPVVRPAIFALRVSSVSIVVRVIQLPALIQGAQPVVPAITLQRVRDLVLRVH